MKRRRLSRVFRGVLLLAILTLAALEARGQVQDTPLGQAEWVSIRHKVDDLVGRELTEHWYPHAVDRRRGWFSSIHDPRLVARARRKRVSRLSGPDDLDRGGVCPVFARLIMMNSSSTPAMGSLFLTR